MVRATDFRQKAAKSGQQGRPRFRQGDDVAPKWGGGSKFVPTHKDVGQLELMSDGRSVDAAQVKQFFDHRLANKFVAEGNEDFPELLPLLKWDTPVIPRGWPKPNFDETATKPRPPRGPNPSKRRLKEYEMSLGCWIRARMEYRIRFRRAKARMYSLVSGQCSNDLLDAMNLTVEGQVATSLGHVPTFLIMIRRAACTGTFVATDPATALDRARQRVEGCQQGDLLLMQYANLFKLESQMYGLARDDFRAANVVDAGEDDGLYGNEVMIGYFIRGLNTEGGPKITVYEADAYFQLQNLLRTGPGSPERRAWAEKHGELTVDNIVTFVQQQVEEKTNAPDATARLMMAYSRAMAKGAHASTASSARDEAWEGDDEASQPGNKGSKKRRFEHTKVPHAQKNAERGVCHACGKPGHYWSAGKCKRGLEWIKAKEHIPAIAAKAHKAKKAVSKKGKLAQAAATKAKGQKLTDKEAKALKAATAAKNAAGARKKAAAAESSDDEGTN
jgi:hypothetical protein